MAYTYPTGLAGPQKEDNEQRLLYKMACIWAAMVAGAAGFLIRGRVTIVPSDTPGSYGVGPYSNRALSATKQVVKATPASLYGYHFTNPNASITYIQFFNKLTANVTVGTTVPDFVLAIPANGVLDTQATQGISFSIGMVIAATTSASNSTAPGTALNSALFYV